MQLLIDSSVDNALASCFVLASTLCTMLYIDWSQAIDDQPLSTFAILGFCVTTQFGALLAQTLSWIPLGRSLYDPVYTFGLLAFYQIIAIATHSAYRFFSAGADAEKNPIRRVLTWGGLYVRPSNRTLWIMGAIGVSAYFVSQYFSARVVVVQKISDAFRVFTWAPFLIPMLTRQYDSKKEYAGLHTALLVIFGLALCVTGLAMNIRQIMFIGLATVGLIYTMNAMQNRSRVTWHGPLKIAGVAVLGLVIAGPIADLATSMAIARAARGKATGLEMIQNTFDIYQKPYAISTYREADRAAQSYSAYDEHYIENPTVARFVETKFHDNAFHFAGLISTTESRERLIRFTLDSFWAVLPAPLLKLLSVNVNKGDVQYSTGDLLVYLTRGVPLGQYKTGSMFAQGQALLGAAFPFLYAIICLILFALMDILTVRSGGTPNAVSALGLIQIFHYFLHGITSDGLHQIADFILRDFWQALFIYCALRFVISQGNRIETASYSAKH